jgi:hypothetical protein
MCINPYIYTTVVKEVYNQDQSPEVDDVEGLANLELLKHKDNTV